LLLLILQALLFSDKVMW